MKKINLLLLLVFVFFACQKQESHSPVADPLSNYYEASLKPFYHGVASGDPLQNAVIIWTKVTPEDSLPELTVQWEISENENFNEPTQTGEVITNPDKGYTVKVDVNGLEPNTKYFYRFNYEGANSLIGETQTAPSESNEALRLAIVSCSNYEFGPFNGYGALAERNDIDVVLHLGDYIYEYGEKGYGDTTTGRFHMPPHEIITLEDYRTRYAQYRLDKDLREVHQRIPFITIWDDHEIANDSYVDGAQNHQENEGDYNDRKAAARKAYYEWLPIRESKELYRSFSYGDMADLIMLDERLAGRVAPVKSADDPNIASEERLMLGTEQLSWFKNELSESDAQWKIIGNQVIFSYLNWGFPTFQLNLDSWDGYPYERTEIINHIRNEQVENVVFVTGDTHSSWALEVTEDAFSDYKTNGAVAVEFGTTSINSGNTNDRAGTTDETVMEHEQNITGSPLNPQLKYANLRDHGYLELILSNDQAEAIWHYTPDKRVASREMVIGKKLITKSGSNKIEEQQ